MSEDIFTTFKLIAKQKRFLEEIKIDWLMKASSKKLIWEQSRTKIVYYGSLENNNNNFLKYNYCVSYLPEKCMAASSFVWIQKTTTAWKYATLC